MSIIFTILFLIALVTFVVALKNPSFLSNNKRQMSRKEIAVGGSIVLIVLLGIIGATAEPQVESIAEQSKAPASPPPVKPTISASPEPKPEQPSATPQPKPEQEIEELVRKQFDEKNNNDRPYIREISVLPDVDSRYIVNVKLNANTNLTSGMTKKGILRDISTIYLALFKERTDVKLGIVLAYAEDANVYSAELSKEQAQTIDFNADENSLKLEIIPSKWKVLEANREFR